MANRIGNPHGGGRNEAHYMMGNSMKVSQLQAFLQEIRAASAESAGQLHALMNNHMHRITELYGGLSQTVGSHENRLNRHDRQIRQLRAANLQLRRQFMERSRSAQNQGQMGRDAGQDDAGIDRPGNRIPPLNRQGNVEHVYAPLSPPDSNDGRRTPRNGDRPTCGYCGRNYAKSYIIRHIRNHCHFRA